MAYDKKSVTHEHVKAQIAVAHSHLDAAEKKVGTTPGIADARVSLGKASAAIERGQGSQRSLATAAKTLSEAASSASVGGKIQIEARNAGGTRANGGGEFHARQATDAIHAAATVAAHAEQNKYFSDAAKNPDHAANRGPGGIPDPRRSDQHDSPNKGGSGDDRKRDDHGRFA